MSETALYRKHRPRTFEEVTGQEHITKPLRAAVENNSFAHAYLFAGSRGTGKTSVARIFAEAIGVAPTDLYEMDAASNRRIDDIRDLREAVAGLPMESAYKLYIIDEVHMLTSESFNALLKTLEEPPAHVVFILATTDPQKLPDTVISRCQVFTFRPPGREILRSTIQSIAQKEGYTIDNGAAELIALLAEGSFRDAIGTLQKVMGSIDSSAITETETAAVTGAPKTSTVNSLLDALGYGDVGSALSLIHAEAASQAEAVIMVTLLLQKLRSILLLRFQAGLEERIQQEVSAEDLELLQKRARDRNFRVTAETIRHLLRVQSEIPRAAVPALPLELAVVEMIGEGENKPEV